MPEDGSLDAAVKRLAFALDALDAAAERRRDVDAHAQGLAQQLHALDADRSRLATALDGETARTHALAAVNREIGQRIDTAMETIRAVIESNDR